MGILLRKIKIVWSSNFAYAIGLIASDGNLNKDGRHIEFASKDIELIENFKKALLIDNKITKHARGGEIDKRYFTVKFGDKVFYKYLNQIGLTAAKSRTIKSVEVPVAFFGDFLRGLFDGDGTFYVFKDKRWPNSFGYKTSFASASPDFICWLKNKTTDVYGVKGYLHKGKGVTNLDYTKGDSRKLFEAMYGRPNQLFFSKKYHKIKAALDQDETRGLIYLQKQRKAAVAQW